MRTLDGTLIVAGGIGSRGEPLADVWALPPQPNDPEVEWRWQPRERMPTARGGCAFGEVFGRLVCAGGEAGATVVRAVELFDPMPPPNTPAWQSLPEMPEGRAGAPGAVIGNRLYIPGGSATVDFEPTGTLFVLSVLDGLPR
jgi:hypothetical protein